MNVNVPIFGSHPVCQVGFGLVHPSAAPQPSTLFTDNPSYFNVPDGVASSRSTTMGASTSTSVSTASSTTSDLPVVVKKRNFRSLLRSVSAHDQRLLVMGEPRPSDKAPTRPLQPLGRPVKPPHQRANSSGNKSSLELLNNDMVLLGAASGEVRYYNLTMPMAGRRRHSIGTFLKPAAVSVAARTKSRCNKCSAGKACKMADILIVSSKLSQAADVWVKYLTSCFEAISKQKKSLQPCRVVSLCIEDVLKAGSTLPETKSRLQIVVLCPMLLEAVCDQPSPVLARLLDQPDRVLAMLLGVDESSLNQQHRNALFSYNQWKHLVVKDQDETFVGQFLEEAVKILSIPTRHHCEREKASFTLMPKKVKEGQNKVLVLLNQPVSKEDKLSVTIDKQGQLVSVDEVKQRNPYTLTFSVPLSCLQTSVIASVTVFANGQSLGSRQIKCESRLRELDQILRSVDTPMQLMCQAFGFTDREQLDNFLVFTFQRNLPPHFNLLQPPPPVNIEDSTSIEELPTLLHFAAQHGLEKLSWQLLECPGGEAASQLKNCNNRVPADLAECNGHNKLASQLRGHMQMNEFTSVYSYMKRISEVQGGFSEVEYHMPRPLSETYQVPRSPFCEPYQVPRSPLSEAYQVPRNMEDNYQIPPSARPVSGAYYMDMHPKLDFLNPMTFDLSPLEAVDRVMKEAREGGGPQDELLEIINDFKNNVSSIAEVENLVATWRNRHDVQQSFKHKQEQLNAMREDYERLQIQIKENMKSASPFDRIRKFFKGSKPKEELPLPEMKHGPGSLLSLHSVCSSSSSGRMSNISACSGTSLGDSGTHSDPDDRNKNAMKNYEIPPAPRPFNKRNKLAIPAFNAPDIPSSMEDRAPCPLPRESFDEIDEVYYIQPEQNNASNPAVVIDQVSADIEYMNIGQPSTISTVTDTDEYLTMEDATSELPEYMNMPAPSAYSQRL